MKDETVEYSREKLALLETCASLANRFCVATDAIDKLSTSFSKMKDEIERLRKVIDDKHDKLDQANDLLINLDRKHQDVLKDLRDSLKDDSLEETVKLILGISGESQ